MRFWEGGDGSKRMEPKGFGRGEELISGMRDGIDLRIEGASFGETKGRWREPSPGAREGGR